MTPSEIRKIEMACISEYYGATARTVLATAEKQSGTMACRHVAATLLRTLLKRSVANKVEILAQCRRHAKDNGNE